jgi:hypothetical protein
MNRKEILGYWDDAISSGTFLTDKHDPSSIGSKYPCFRTVTINSQSEIGMFLASGNYTLRQYHNNDYPTSPYFIEIVPSDTSMVAGSGVQPNSSVPTTACDRFVAVSGVNQGWHLYAEQSAIIQNKQSNGTLTYLTDLL